METDKPEQKSADMKCVSNVQNIEPACDPDAQNKTEQKYIKLVRKCMKMPARSTRNGVTIGIFGKSISFKVYDDRRKSYLLPLLTTKKMGIAPIHWELLWFLRGDTNIKYLNEHGVKIWNDNAAPEYLATRNLTYPQGELGPVYGAQWRGKGSSGVDQIGDIIKSLKADPMSRRHLVVSWNLADLGAMALPPCHWAFQFYVSSRGLCILVHMRSGDICLGVPYNLVSYTFLLYIIAAIIGRPAHKVTLTFGDLHIYEEHIEAAREQCGREICAFPTVSVDPVTQLINGKKIQSIEDALELTPADWGLANYTPAAPIKYEMKA